MCGVAGEYGGARAGGGERMLGRLTHRGPDDRGEVRVNGSWLGHTRLSIVDVAGGRQPLHDSQSGLWLVGNGEIYNHEQVRETLGPLRSATGSDNEVALHLLSARDPGLLDRLEGMYAFLAAGEDGFFLAARDPVGIKPLYWARRDGAVRFASEMSAFDPDWMPHVEAFPPGWQWTPQAGLRRFATAVPAGAAAADDGPAPRPAAELPAEALEATRAVLVSSVERQMMGDVPVGVFLSGGLDSSLVAAIAARCLEGRDERLQTFAVGIEGSPDLIAARTVADHLGSEHHECVYTVQQALDAVPRVVRAIEHFDPSLVRSAVPNYLLAEMTAEHVKVVLTGEGADELFAGYEYLRDFGTAGELQDEMVRMVEGLHSLNLQRCDRVTMAHGLEARVPFLDRQVIEFALGLPAEWKLAAPGSSEKRLLREAFEGWLPAELLWREKAEFGDGSGAAAALRHRMEETVGQDEFERDRDITEPALRTREELAYYRIFARHLPGVRAEQTVSRFATA